MKFAEFCGIWGNFGFANLSFAGFRRRRRKQEWDVDKEDEEEEEGRANKRGQRTKRYCKDFTYAFQLITCGHSAHFATEEERKQAYWKWGDDEDLLMPDNLTLDTNNEGELKLEIKQLKISLAKIWRKIEELTTVVEELRKDAKTKVVVEESNEKEEGSEKEYEEEGGEEDSEKEGGEEEGKEEGEEPNEGEREEKTEADAKEEDREVPDGEESKKSRGNDGEDRGKAIVLVHGTGDWDSPTNICVKLVKLLEEAVVGRYKDINGSDDEYDVVVSLLMGSI
ncbi:unnamed protein product [Malus baccata var. baccata]